MNTNERRMILELARLSGHLITVATETLRLINDEESSKKIKAAIEDSMNRLGAIAEIMDKEWTPHE